MSGRDLDELIVWAEGRLPAIIDHVFTTVMETIPVYRETDRITADELRRSIEDNVRFLVGALRHPGVTLDLSVPEGTGRRRAHQGVPLPEVLHVYRIGFATLWNAIAGRANSELRPAVLGSLLATSTFIWEVADEHATALTDAYRAATAEMLISQEHRRAALVEVLLTGHVGRDAGPWEAAALLGFPPGAELLVVAAHTREVAVESMPGIEKALSSRGFVSAWRLTPSLQLGVIAAHPGNTPAVLEVLASQASARAGVSPAYLTPADTPRSLRLARAALNAIPRASHEVRMFSSSPIAALLATDPAEANRLATRVLGSVLNLPDADRSVLLDTLNAYLAANGSATDAALTLHCHANTVRYRLRRIEELTGRSFSVPEDVAELATATLAVDLSDTA